MQVSVQKLSPVLVEFDVQIDPERVHSELEKAFSKVSKTARIRGFRPGKAPRKVIRQVFGSSVAADVAQRLVEETFPKAVTEQNVQPVSEPDFEPHKLVDNKPFSYKARFEVIPEIESVTYEGLEARRPPVEASPEQIEQRLQNLRRDNATLEPPEPARPAEKGDIVTIDYVVEVEGSPVEEAGAKDFQLELGAGNIIEAIEQALMGAGIGETVEASVAMPEGHPLPALKGKTAVFKLTLQDLKVRVLPELDDEFAKDLGDYDNLEELKASVKTEIEKSLKDQSDNKLAEQLVSELVKRNDIPVPGSLVQQQARMTEQEILARARSQGQQATGLGDELRGQILADSEAKVKAGLLMAEIAKAEEIKIGDPEIEEGLKELAEQTGKNVAKLRVEYRDKRKREMLVGMILENKVLDLIETRANITVGPVETPEAAGDAPEAAGDAPEAAGGEGEG